MELRAGEMPKPGDFLARPRVLDIIYNFNNISGASKLGKCRAIYLSIILLAQLLCRKSQSSLS